MSEKRFITINDATTNDWELHDQLLKCTTLSTNAIGITKLLNELSEENEQLKIQLQNTSAQRDEFHHGARENANRVGKLKKENEQLKKELESFEQVSFTDLCDGSRTTLYMKKEKVGDLND